VILLITAAIILVAIVLIIVVQLDDTGYFGAKITGLRRIVSRARPLNEGSAGEGAGWIRRSRKSNDSSVRIEPT